MGTRPTHTCTHVSVLYKPCKQLFINRINNDKLYNVPANVAVLLMSGRKFLFYFKYQELMDFSNLKGHSYEKSLWDYRFEL
jgi:hypothetical protein